MGTTRIWRVELSTVDERGIDGWKTYDVEADTIEKAMSKALKADLRDQKRDQKKFEDFEIVPVEVTLARLVVQSDL